MSCDSVFHQYLQSIAEFWPVRFSLALSLAPASSGFCNSLTNKLSGIGGGGRNRLSIPAVASQICLILLAIQALPALSDPIIFNLFGVRFEETPVLLRPFSGVAKGYADFLAMDRSTGLAQGPG